jgi:hypothetical protein
MLVRLCAAVVVAALLSSSVTLAAKADTRCATCRRIASRFTEGMEKTKGGHFGGGNTAWEEKKLGEYDKR